MMMLHLPVKLLHRIALRLKLEAYGVKCGNRIKGNRVVIKNMGQIIIGNTVSLKSFPDGEPYRTGLQTHCEDAVIRIGDNP